MDEKDLLEELAELEHKQWSDWIHYQINNLNDENWARWINQAMTPFNALTEKEKESDREWARKVLDILKKYGGGESV